MRKCMALAVGVLALVAFPAAAWANDCVNVSRPGGDTFEQKGRWTSVPIEELGGNTWAFSTPDNFHNSGGDGGVLLEGSGACNSHRRGGQTQGDPSDLSKLEGIWSEECVIEASS